MRRSLSMRPPVWQVRAVVDGVLLEVDARDRRAVALARHGRACRGRGRPSRRSRRRGVARARDPSPSGSPWSAARASSPSTWLESGYGDSCAAQRISFAHARPIPAINRWSRRSECKRRESDARMRATSSTSSVVGLGAEVRELGLRGLRPQQPDARALLRPGFRELQLAAVDEPQPKHRRLRSLAALRYVLQPAGAHQMHEHDELAVVGRQQEPLRPPFDAPQPLALERLQRRIERLQRGDVGGARLLDRRPLDERIELTAPRLDLWQLRHPRQRRGAIRPGPPSTLRFRARRMRFRIRPRGP